MDSQQHAAVLFGFGYWGPNILRNIQSSRDFRIHTVVEPDRDQRARAVAAAPEATACADADGVRWDEVDAVFIATPPQTHAPLGHEALRHGKHVWVEKPLCTSFDEAIGLWRASQDAGVALWVDLPYLFHASVQALIADCRDGRFGTLTYALTNRSNFGLYHQTVDVIRDLLVHDLAIMQALVQEPPLAVSASRFHETQPGCATMAFLTTEWGSGLVMLSVGNQLAATKSRLFEIRGTLGAAQFDDNSAEAKLSYVFPDVDRMTADQRRMLNARHALADLVLPNVPAQEPLAASMSAFAERIRGGVTGLQGVDPVTISLRSHLWVGAADESIALNGQRVELASDAWRSL